MTESITDIIQQSAMNVAKAINKPLKSRIALPTRMSNREMVMALKSLRKDWKTQTQGQDRIITFLDKLGRKIQAKDEAIEQI